MVPFGKSSGSTVKVLAEVFNAMSKARRAPYLQNITQAKNTRTIVGRIRPSDEFLFGGKLAEVSKNLKDSAQLNPLSMYRGKGRSNYSSRYKGEDYQSLRSIQDTYAFKKNQPRRGGFGGSYRSAKKQSKDPKRG